MNVASIVPNLIQEQLGRPRADLVARLTDRRQRHYATGGVVDIVVPDDRHVVGHPQATGRERL